MWLVVIIVLALLIPEILSTVLDSQLARALAARIEAGTDRQEDQATADRIRYLEGEVDRLSADVQRLHEESEFLHRLLEQRPSAENPRILPGDRNS